MSKKVILIILAICSILFFSSCGTTVKRMACDCDCCYCECGEEHEERNPYNDPSEYEGWRD